MICGRLRKQDFDFLVDKIHHRLHSWKSKLLNKAGRLALAQSVLASIPTYYMQVAWLPKSICDIIDRTTRNFIWKGNSDRGIHLVGWDKITKTRKEGGLGIRKARDSNSAMLGKLVWDLHSNAEKLWVKLLKQKYVGDNLFLDIPKKPGSIVWNSIMKARGVLRDGFEFRLGNGASSFWTMSWPGVGTLRDQVWYVDIHDIDLTIAEVYQDGNWNFSSLYTQLPPHVLDLLSSIPVCLNDNIVDGYSWKGNLDGMYSAKAGYSWLTKCETTVAEDTYSNSWNWIWKMKAPEKLNFFIWTACHEALPTRLLLNRRGMLHAPNCPRCASSDESILHCLRDCSFSKQVWRSLGFDNINFFLHQSISTWFRKGIESNRPHLFLSSCWWIWRARNQLCMENVSVSIFTLKLEIHKFAKTIADAFYSQQDSVFMEKWISWHTLEGTAIVLNIDGSSLGNPGPSGFGGLLRHPDGTWIFGFAGSVGISTVIHVELLAMYHGFRMAWDRGIRDLVCYSDSMLAIQLVKAEVNPWHYYASLISNIKDLMNRNWSIRLLHSWREANAAADCLAKRGASGAAPWIGYEVPPAEVIPILLADASRLPVARR